MLTNHLCSLSTHELKLLADSVVDTWSSTLERDERELFVPPPQPRLHGPRLPRFMPPQLSPELDQLPRRDYPPCWQERPADPADHLFRPRPLERPCCRMPRTASNDSLRQGRHRKTSRSPSPNDDPETKHLREQLRWKIDQQR